MNTYLKILNEKQKKEIEDKLEERFGVDSIPGKIVMRGGERLFLYSGDLDEKEIREIEATVFVERVGIYFAKIDEDGEIRLSIEGTQIIGNQVKKNFFVLDEGQLEKWMMGNELNIKSGMKGFVIIKYKNEFLGTGKASEEKISNFIPKNRRLKEKS